MCTPKWMQFRQSADSKMEAISNLIGEYLHGPIKSWFLNSFSGIDGPVRRRMSMRFTDYESEDASEEAVRVRRLMRLSPVAESDDDDVNDRVQDRPKRRHMRLLPDDYGDEEEEEEDDDSVDRVEERPRQKRMRLPDDESDDYS